MGSTGRVYVGNLPDDATEATVRDRFEKHGEVEFCDVKKSRNGQCFAFIKYQTSDGVNGAIEKENGTEVDGKALRVEMPFASKPKFSERYERRSRYDDRYGRGEPRGSRQSVRGKYMIEITDLPASGSWQDIKDHFRPAGPIGHADASRTGYGEVSFFSRRCAEKALDLFHGSSFESHEGERGNIRCRLVAPRERSREISGERKSRRYEREPSRSRDYDRKVSKYSRYGERERRDRYDSRYERDERRERYDRRDRRSDERKHDRRRRDRYASEEVEERRKPSPDRDMGHRSEDERSQKSDVSRRDDKGDMDGDKNTRRTRSRSQSRRSSQDA